MLELQGPQVSRCSFEGEGYKLHFYRYDGALSHAVCHLDIFSDFALARNAQKQLGVLETARWEMAMSYDPRRWGPEKVSVMCSAHSMLKEPGSPLCGFRLGMTVDVALTIIDSYQRSGNLMLHIFMKDGHGKPLEILTPILPGAATLYDPHGYLQERLVCDYTRRN